jgi:macrodomain Ter protein organizer (MatP/YcbG family)
MQCTRTNKAAIGLEYTKWKRLAVMMTTVVMHIANRPLHDTHITNKEHLMQIMTTIDQSFPGSPKR